MFARLREAIVDSLDAIEQDFMRLDKLEQEELENIQGLGQREEERRQHNGEKKEQLAQAMQQIFGQWQQHLIGVAAAANSEAQAQSE
eukprot:3640091-Rhodomonas_salina.1